MQRTIDFNSTSRDFFLKNGIKSYKLPISSRLQSNHIFRVEQTYYNLESNIWFQLHGITSESGSYLATHHVDQYLFEEQDNAQLRVKFSLSPDKLLVHKVAYSAFDFLSSIGGQLFCLILISRYLLSIVNFKALDNFLVSKLFKRSLTREQIKKMVGTSHDPRASIIVRQSPSPGDSNLSLSERDRKR